MPILTRILPAYNSETENHFPKPKNATKNSWISDRVLEHRRINNLQNWRQKQNNKSSAKKKNEAQDEYDRRTKFNEQVSVQLLNLAKFLKRSYHRIAKIKDPSVDNVVVIKGRVLAYSKKLNKKQKQICSRCGEVLDAGTVNKNYRYVCSSCANILGFKRGEQSLRIHARSKTIKNCGNKFTTYKCKNCGTHVIGNNVFYCKDKLCAHCAHNRSSKIKDRLSVVFGEYMKQHGFFYRLRLLTLTIKNCIAGQLYNAVKKLRESFSKLRRRKIFKGVKGGFYSIEITYNEYSDTWHPHIHCIIFSDTDLDKYEVSRLWYKITKDSMVCDIRHINVDVDKGDSLFDDEVSLDGGISEVAKYITKLTVDKKTGELPAVFRNPERLLELLSVIYRLRQYHGFGDFYGLDSVLDKILELENDLETTEIKRDEIIARIAELQEKYGISDELILALIKQADDSRSDINDSLPDCPCCGAKDYEFSGLVTTECAKLIYMKNEELTKKARET